MKKFTGIFLTAIVCLASCSRLDNIDKRIDALESKVSALETQYNTDITSLQSAVKALQANKFVTSVTVLKEGGETVGYTVSLSDGSSFPIYHGKQGEKGDKGDTGLAGKDGSTPVMGVAKDEDGIWYWTVDGAFLKDAEGNKIVAAAKDGKDGQDGITPLMKIEDNYWKLSYDNGQTWTTLSKAVGEDGQDGRTLFSGIEESEDSVALVLVSGDTLKLPTLSAFQKLELRIQTLNEELVALKKVVDAIQLGDYITEVRQTEKEGRTGYVFVFNKYGTVEIFNGKDGEKGDTGKDGDTPAISVASEDGVWYWKLNGEWLLDSDGNRVRTTGASGTDGITPLLKIEDCKWYFSYDGGENWTEAGPSKGKDGQDLFASVDVTDTDVTFKLASDGTVFTVKRKIDLTVILDEQAISRMDPSSTEDFEYEVESASEDITIEVLTSRDIKAKVIETDSHTGIIRVQTGESFDQYSKLSVMVTDGCQIVVRNIFFGTYNSLQ